HIQIYTLSLHDALPIFEVLGGDGKFENAGELVNALTENYGSVESFIKFFSECAMAARGWSILAWDTKEGRLWIYNNDAHNQGGRSEEHTSELQSPDHLV